MDFHAFLIMCFRESRMKNRIFLINYLLEIKKNINEKWKFSRRCLIYGSLVRFIKEPAYLLFAYNPKSS